MEELNCPVSLLYFFEHNTTKYVVSTAPRGNIFVWPIMNTDGKFTLSKEVRKIQGRVFDVYSSASFLERGKDSTLVLASMDGNVDIWNFENGTFIASASTIRRDSFIPHVMTCTVDNENFIVGSLADGMHIWDLQGKSILVDARPAIKNISQCLGVLKTMYTGHANGTITHWQLKNTASFGKYDPIEAHAGPVTCIHAFEKDKKEFVVSVCGSEIKIWAPLDLSESGGKLRSLGYLKTITIADSDQGAGKTDIKAISVLEKGTGNLFSCCNCRVHYGYQYFNRIYGRKDRV